MPASYTFRPKTSIRSRKAAIDSTFISPLYRRRVRINYRVFYMAASYIFATSFYRYFYLRSAYLTISIVDLYLYQQPPILYRRYSARSLPSRLVVPVFPFLSLPLIGRGLPSQYNWAYLLFKEPSLFIYILFLIYILVFSVFFLLLGGLIL